MDNITKVYTIIILLILSFFLKLLIGRFPTWDEFIKAMLDLPGNLAGASLSLACGYFISSKELNTLHDGTPIILCYVVTLIVSLFILKATEKIKYSGIWYKVLFAFILWIVNLCGSLYCLFTAAKLLIPQLTIDQVLK